MFTAVYFCFICLFSGVINEAQSTDVHEELEALRTVVFEQSRLLKELQSSVDRLRQKNEFLQNAYTDQKQELQTLKEGLRKEGVLPDSIPHSDARNEVRKPAVHRLHTEEQAYTTSNERIVPSPRQPTSQNSFLRNKSRRLLIASGPEDHVAFTAFHNHTGETVTTGQTIVLQEIKQNIGGGLHTNGVFTAKVQGIYVFFFSLNCDGNSDAFVKIVKDTTELARTYCAGHHDDLWIVSSTMATTVLAPGDAVWLKVTGTAKIGAETSFSGFLLR